jgi:hypothetical protein
MAMTKCKECGNEISTKATSCPKCGAKIKHTSWFTKLIAGFIGLVVILSIFSSISSSNKQERLAAEEQARIASLTPEQRAQEDARRKLQTDAQEKDRKMQSASGACMLFIKQALHDPSSAEFSHSSESIVSHKGNRWTVVRPVRAKNAFGAYVREKYLCTMSVAENGDWSLISIKPM